MSTSKNIAFNIDIDPVVIYANKLERISEKAFPNVVRGTLNSAAFALKKDHMPSEAKKAFTHREKNFFRANSRVKMAQGMVVNEMSSVFGFYPNSAIQNNQAVEDLEVQEEGGTIENRTYIPTNNARVGKNRNRRIRKKYRLKEIGAKGIVNTARNYGGKNEKERFVRSVIHAGVGGFVQATTKQGKEMVWEVRGFSRAGRKRWKHRLVPVYIVNKSESVEIKKATNFMEKATKKTNRAIYPIFVKEANREYDKYFR